MKPILIAQNCEIETAGTIIDYLRERSLPFEVVHTYRGEELPDPANVDASIVLGCPESVTRYREFPYLEKLYAFVARSVRLDRPYLGVCFGGQLLARVLGAEVKPNPVKELGITKVRLTDAGKNDVLFAGFNDIFDVFQWHGDTFKVPFGAELLVEGTDCKNQAFRKGRQTGLQFHLETPLAEAGAWCDRYGHELVEVRQTRDSVLSAYQPLTAATQSLNYKLLDNFFRETLQ